MRFFLGFTSHQHSKGYMATVKLYLWRKTFCAPPCIISGMSGHLSRTLARKQPMLELYDPLCAVTVSYWALRWFNWAINDVITLITSVVFQLRFKIQHESRHGITYWMKAIERKWCYKWERSSRKAMKYMHKIKKPPRSSCDLFYFTTSKTDEKASIILIRRSI